jgi:hypothetical protein
LPNDALDAELQFLANHECPSQMEEAGPPAKLIAAAPARQSILLASGTNSRTVWDLLASPQA